MKKLLILSLLFVFVSCANKTEKVQENTTLSETTKTMNKEENNILLGTGSDSKWTLSMAADQTVEFDNTEKGQEFTVTGKVTEISPSADGNMLTFMTDAQDGKLYFNLIPRELGAYTLQVVASNKPTGKEKMFSGTGKTFGVYRLNGTWVLTSLNGKSVEQGENTPDLTIALFEGKLYGFSGCNRIMGTVSLEDNQELVFGPMNMTRRACMDDKYETDFMMTLQAQDRTVELLDSGDLKIVGSKNELVLKRK